jgi:RES domain
VSIAWNGPHNATVLAVAKVAAGLPLIDISGTLFRAVWLQYIIHPPGGGKPQPLYYLGSTQGARYTPFGGPAGLYLGFDQATLPAELRVLQFIRGVPTKARAADPFTTFSVTARVHRILDLTDASITSALGLTRALLRVQWEAKMKAYRAGTGAMPATQLLTVAAHGLGTIAGIKFASVRNKKGTNLVVFPDRLDPAIGDSLDVVDSTRAIIQHLP